MTSPIFPKKLQTDDTIEIIAPSRSLYMIDKEVQNVAMKRFESEGLHLMFGKHVMENDEFISSSIASRVEDFMGAFQNPNANGIATVIGGFNSNQLLRSIDWQIIQSNPKIFFGYSDITVLSNAIYAKTGLITYSAPHYSTFGQLLHFEYTLDYWKKCLMSDEPFELTPSDTWTDDDAWWSDQQDRNPIPNEGWWILQKGEAEGVILGGNLGTFNLLQGTEYMPDLENSILFFEDDCESQPHHFDRDLQSVIHQPGFSGVKALVIGRFQKASNMTREVLQKIIDTKKELEKIPVIANVDFGHTDPKITFPIGGTCKILQKGGIPSIFITKH
jgi:muramoyltetrapeptide carboxypeptidase